MTCQPGNPNDWSISTSRARGGIIWRCAIAADGTFAFTASHRHARAWKLLSRHTVEASPVRPARNNFTARAGRVVEDSRSVRMSTEGQPVQIPENCRPAAVGHQTFTQTRCEGERAHGVRSEEFSKL